jgi:hypothetical protein
LKSHMPLLAPANTIKPYHQQIIKKKKQRIDRRKRDLIEPEFKLNNKRKLSSSS